MQVRFYIDPVTGAPHIHNHHVAEEEVIEILEKPGEDRPGREGWSEERVRKVLAHYEAQTENGAVAEDEAAVESSETVMSVPHDLVPIVRELIA